MVIVGADGGRRRTEFSTNPPTADDEFEAALSNLIASRPEMEYGCGTSPMARCRHSRRDRSLRYEPSLFESELFLQLRIFLAEAIGQ